MNKLHSSYSRGRPERNGCLCVTDVVTRQYGRLKNEVEITSAEEGDVASAEEATYVFVHDSF